MQSKQLYIRRKVLLDGDQKIFRERNREIERETDHSKTEMDIPEEH